MANIGEEHEVIEVEPLPLAVPVEEPVTAPVEEPERVPA